MNGYFRHTPLQGTETPLRDVEINGHQEYWTGKFHCWTHVKGEAFALVEGDRGEISMVSATKIKFTQPCSA